MDSLPISVVIPARNSAATIARSVRGALGQQPRPPAEVIVVDDGSNDETAAKAQAAGARVIRRDGPAGVSAGRNVGIRAAAQAWIATLDSDDAWLNGHLDTVWRAKRSEILVSTSALACGSDPAQDSVWGVSHPLRLDHPAKVLVPSNPVINSGAVFRRDVALEVGLFPEGVARSEDLDLWIRLLERGEGLAMPDVTVLYTLHDAQASNDREAMLTATHEVAMAYRGRPWWSRSLERRLEGCAGWDELRAAMRRRETISTVRRGARIAVSPNRIRGVAELLRARANLRRSNASGLPDGKLHPAWVARNSPEWLCSYEELRRRASDSESPSGG